MAIDFVLPASKKNVKFISDLAIFFQSNYVRCISHPKISKMTSDLSPLTIWKEATSSQ